MPKPEKEVTIEMQDFSAGQEVTNTFGVRYMNAAITNERLTSLAYGQKDKGERMRNQRLFLDELCEAQGKPNIMDGDTYTSTPFVDELSEKHIDPITFSQKMEEYYDGIIKYWEGKEPQITNDKELEKKVKAYESKKIKDATAALKDPEQQKKLDRINSQLTLAANLYGKTVGELEVELISKGEDPKTVAEKMIWRTEDNIKKYEGATVEYSREQKKYQIINNYYDRLEAAEKEAAKDPAKKAELDKFKENLFLLAAAEGKSEKEYIRAVAQEGKDPVAHVNEAVQQQAKEINDFKQAQYKEKYDQREAELNELSKLSGIPREKLNEIVKNTGAEVNQYAKFVPGTKEFDEKQKNDALQQEKDAKAADLKAKEEAEAQKKAAEEAELKASRERLEKQQKEKHDAEVEQAKKDIKELSQVKKEFDELKPDDGLDKLNELEAKRNAMIGKAHIKEGVASRMDLAENLGISANTPEEIEKLTSEIADKYVGIAGEPAENFPKDPNNPEASALENKMAFMNSMLTDKNFLNDPKNKTFADQCLQNFKDELNVDPEAANNRMKEALESSVSLNASGETLSVADIELKTALDCVSKKVNDCKANPTPANKNYTDALKQAVTGPEGAQLASKCRGITALGTVAANSMVAKNNLITNPNMPPKEREKAIKDYLMGSALNELSDPARREAEVDIANNRQVSTNLQYALGMTKDGSAMYELEKQMSRTEAFKQLCEMDPADLAKKLQEEAPELNRLGADAIKDSIEQLEKTGKFKSKAREVEKNLDLEQKSQELAQKTQKLEDQLQLKEDKQVQQPTGPSFKS